jgi:hypothetical protein
MRHPRVLMWTLSTGGSVIIPKLLLNMINAAAAFALGVTTCAWSSLSLPH